MRTIDFMEYEYFINIESSTDDVCNFLDISFQKNHPQYYPVFHDDLSILTEIRFYNHLIHKCVFYNSDIIYLGVLTGAFDNKLTYRITDRIIAYLSPTLYNNFVSFLAHNITRTKHKIQKNPYWNNPYYNGFLLHSEPTTNSSILDANAIFINQNNNIMALYKNPIFVYQRGFCWKNGEYDTTSFDYWTINHLQTSGIIMPDGQIRFLSYTEFYQIIRCYSNSKFEKQLIDCYLHYVDSLSLPEQLATPLLIPEFRFGNRSIKHKYRLDFLIINLRKHTTRGFEISPGSTHFGEEKLWKRDIYKANDFGDLNTTIYTFTDAELCNIPICFDKIKYYLTNV